MKIGLPFNKVLIPFTNLTLKARVVQIIRLMSSFISVLLILVMMIGSLRSGRLYVSKIGCAQLDVAYGLYKSLRDSVSSKISFQVESEMFPVDSSLTNSEIEILTQYAQSQVSGAPQYISIYLWRPCLGYYDTSQYTDSHGQTYFKKYSDVVKCLPNHNYFIFDYRTMLDEVGLRSILSYAFQSSDFDDESYKSKVKKRHQMYNLIVNTLYVSVISQAIVLLMTFIAYANRGKENVFKKKFTVFLNILAVISVVSFLSFAVGLGLLTRFLVLIASEMKKHLGDYGINLMLGPVWFSLSWIVFGSTLVSMLSWTLPLWCANPEEPGEFDIEETEPFNTGRYRGWNRNTSEQRASTFNAFPSSSKETEGGAPNSNFNGVHEIPATELDDEVAPPSEDHDMGIATDFSDKFLTEESLRKLGESMSRKSSVRQLKFKRGRRSGLGETIAEDETKNLLYNDLDNDLGHYPRTNLMSNHYREETFDGYATSGSKSSSKNPQNQNNYNNTSSSTRVFRHETIKSNSSKTSKKDIDNFSMGRSNSKKEQAFQHNTNNNPFLTTHENFVNNSNRDSFLNEEEMEILDSNFYINKM